MSGPGCIFIFPDTKNLKPQFYSISLYASASCFRISEIIQTYHAYCEPKLCRSPSAGRLRSFRRCLVVSRAAVASVCLVSECAWMIVEADL